VSLEGRPVGQQRGIAFAIVLGIVTIGIYTLYWIYKSYSEVRARRGQGVGGIAGILLSLVIVGIFLLPAYVGRMHREDGRDAPMSGWSGLWALVPYIGSFIWIAQIQIALNRYWQTAA
jgi:uncharacterized membrane protein YhaH (DUF805 family)